MTMLSEDDLDIAELSDSELAAAWDLWFDLAQATNDHDPEWTHGVFVGVADQGAALADQAQGGPQRRGPGPPDG